MTIIAVLASYLCHRLEVDAYLHLRAQQVLAVRHQNKQHTDPLGVQERLLTRQPTTRP